VGDRRCGCRILVRAGSWEQDCTSQPTAPTQFFKDLDKAEGYAKELLWLARRYRNDANYGKAVFFGNMMIGRVVLRRDKNISLAKSYPLASGHTPGRPRSDPNMSLAKDLLTVGERDTVLEFFALRQNFWESHNEQLDDWTAVVKGGGTPYFGANLIY
jgi:hypothetical protein